MKYLITIFLCSLLSFISLAQNDSTSIYNVTDQLGSSKSSRAIYKGVLLTNLNYNHSEVTYPTWDGEGYHVVSDGFKFTAGYGVFKGVDIKMGIAFFDTDASRINSISVGSKVNLMKQTKWYPELALSGGYSYTTKNSDFYDAALSWSYKLGSKFRLGGNFAYVGVVSRLGGTSEFFDSFNYTVNARYEFGRGIGVFADIPLPKSLDDYSSMPEIGTYYRINKNMQFHIRYNQLISTDNNPTQLYNLGGGFSWLLGNN
jgi:hypothetical protein